MCEYLKKFNEGKLVDLLKAVERVSEDIDGNMPCLHVDENGNDAVKFVTDKNGNSTGIVYCPHCMQQWAPQMMDKNIVKDTCNNIITDIQNIIWLNHGNIDCETLKALKITVEMLSRIPELHDDTILQIESIKAYYTQKY